MIDNTDIIQRAKDANPIEDLVSEDGYPLAGRGKWLKVNRPGTGGLVLNTHDQCFHWNARDMHGDVIRWVEYEHKLDFKEAVNYLCRRARLPEPNWGHQDMATRAAARAREDALSVAVRVFQKWLRSDAAATAYCQARGWSTVEGEGEERKPGSIQKAQLGYSGEGTREEREEMRKELLAAGVDLDSPVAVAITGMQGDVAAWAKRHNLQASELNDEWLLKGYIPGMIGYKRLVYPHIKGGRVVYLSGRSIDAKYHYNLPEVLIGERQPYYSYEYAPRENQVVIVEGQADAVSLAQWGIPALALAGVTPGEGLQEALQRHKVIYVGLDADEAGQKNAWKVADQLGPMVRLVSWHNSGFSSWAGSDGAVNSVKDANDLLRSMHQKGLDRKEQMDLAHKLLEGAPTYVESVCSWAGSQQGAARDAALQQAIAVVARLDEFSFNAKRSPLAKSLQIGVRELQNMLKVFEKVEKERVAGGEPVFTWGGQAAEGWLIEYLYNPDKHEAYLAWRDPEGKVGSGPNVTIDGRRYEPYPPNDVLRNEAVIFPSRLGDKREIRELVAIVEMYIKSVYLLPSDRVSRLMAYYILLTWVYDSFETIIYLRAMGGAGSGKSELMRRIGLICYRTMTANGAGSTSSLFRALERYKGTVFIDEADIQNSDTESDMVKFYNLGAMKNNPIWRTVEVTGPDGNKDWESVSFQTFCPKLVAMRKEFRDDAVGSRSLTFKLQPREMTELKAAGIPLSITAGMREKARALRNLLVRFRLETWRPNIEIDMDYYDLTISARLNQVAGPLLAIAAEDPDQQEDIRRNLREYYAETILNKSMTKAARVLEALWKIWNYPDLHRDMIKVESDGSQLIKVGDVTRIANELMDEMNETDDEVEEEQEDDAKPKWKKKRTKMTPRSIGHILREDFQLQMSERRRDGFWVFFNEPRLLGLSTRFGVNPSDFGPQEGKEGSNGHAQKPVQKPLV